MSMESIKTRLALVRNSLKNVWLENDYQSNR